MPEDGTPRPRPALNSPFGSAPQRPAKPEYDQMSLWPSDQPVEDARREAGIGLSQATGENQMPPALMAAILQLMKKEDINKFYRRLVLDYDRRPWWKKLLGWT